MIPAPTLRQWIWTLKGQIPLILLTLALQVYSADTDVLQKVPPPEAEVQVLKGIATCPINHYLSQYISDVHLISSLSLYVITGY